MKEKQGTGHILRILPIIAALTFPFLAVAGSFQDARPDWLRVQSFIHASDGDLRHDIARAADEGKALMVIWEQAGCIYCARMHKENFQRREIVQLLDDNFVIIQLDIGGQRPVTGLDGTPMTEAELARRWRVTTSPTTVVLSARNPGVERLKSAEVFRMPGLLNPFRYYAVMHFFASGAYESEELGDHFAMHADELTARGIDPETW